MILRPVTFVLAIVAAVITGNRTDSFWFGFLAFFIAVGAGRVLGAVIRGRVDRALYKAIWPGAATGYAFLFDDLGLPRWALTSLRRGPRHRNDVRCRSFHEPPPLPRRSFVGSHRPAARRENG